MIKATAKDGWGDKIEAEKYKGVQQITFNIIPGRGSFPTRSVRVCLPFRKARRFFESGIKMCKELEENK